MNFEELKDFIRSRWEHPFLDVSKMQEADWHRQSLPWATQPKSDYDKGGWVENTASVDPSASVYEDCVVMGQARVGAGAVIKDWSMVRGKAEIGEKAVIYAGSLIEDAVVIAPGAVVGSSHFSGGARVNLQVVIGVNCHGDEFFKKHLKRGRLKGVFFNGSQAGETEEITRERNQAVEDWKKRGELPRKWGQRRVPYPGGKYFSS